MTDLNTIAKEIDQLDMVASTNVWKERRVYVNLIGFNRSFTGDRNTKVYYDIKTGWSIDMGKGTRTTELHNNVEAFREHIEA